MIATENLQSVVDTVQKLLNVQDTNEVQPLPENENTAVYLLYLNDLLHILMSCRTDGVKIDIDSVAKKLEEFYVQKLSEQKGNYFLNLKKILEKKECREHLLYSLQDLEKNQ